MDYKIKYTDALEGIRELYNSDCDMIRVKRLRRQLEHIFPELKESKDEKIKREIVAYINELADLKNEKIPTKWLNWLEKQGQKETTWNKEDEENMNNILYVFNQLKDTSFYKEDNTAEKIINWLKSLKDRLCSNNEYDKDMLGAIEYCKKNNRPLEKEHIAWLEKQSKQDPVEWSEEDEKIKESIKKVLANTNFNKLDIKYSFYEMISWLEKQGEQKSSNIPSRETILAIWELGNDWKELTNGSISTEYGTQLEYIQKHWQESSYYNLEEVTNES